MNAQEFDALVAVLPELNARMIAKMAVHHQVRGPWTELDLHRAFDKLREEVVELQNEMHSYRLKDSDYNAVANECADVANCAMMIMARIKFLEEAVAKCESRRPGSGVQCQWSKGHTNHHQNGEWMWTDV